MSPGGRVSRRVLLGGAAAAAASLAGCATDRPAGKRAGSPSTTPMTPSDSVTNTAAAGSDRDVALAALAEEQSTLAVYGALARRRPEARPQIAPLMAIQRRHVEALTTALELERPPSPRRVDTLAVAPLGRVIGATATDAAEGRMADCRQVVSGSLASMLASMAAAHRAVSSQWTAP